MNVLICKLSQIYNGCYNLVLVNEITNMHRGDGNSLNEISIIRKIVIPITWIRTSAVLRTVDQNPSVPPLWLKWLAKRLASKLRSPHRGTVLQLKIRSKNFVLIVSLHQLVLSLSLKWTNNIRTDSYELIYMNCHRHILQCPKMAKILCENWNGLIQSK